MAIVTLMNISDPAFGFENDMAHRALLADMVPLPSFSVAPYLLDPMRSNDPWRTMHQQAHTDARTALAVNIVQNLLDIDFRSPDQSRWWTWAHLLEHQALMAVLPPELI